MFWRSLLLSIVCLLFSLIVALPGTTLGTFMNTGGQPLMDNFQLARKVFTQSGANLEEINLQVWGQISNTVNTEEEVKTQYRILAEILGPGSIQPVVQKEKDGFLSLSSLTEQGENILQLVIQTVPMGPGQGGTFLGLSFRTNDVTAAREMYGNISAYLSSLASGHQVGVMWTGTLPGKLSFAQRFALAQSLAQTVGAYFVDGLEEDELTSLTYYSKRGQGFLTVNERKLNINIALRFHADRGVTYLHVGSPLIFQEY